ncbi:efflux RND transporter periplasmic adaptor subunit [Desulfospira joergensenii]|uniref:efflux RND transporter periplasmic adaptor subunit n=1 Tax=Desulfospira joergensenii TaxID=53329 RepID=UPI0003B587E7|nr:HlyD family efflux transporter periplasmic adaptor subunit [Desulfospira joergensenii]
MENQFRSGKILSFLFRLLRVILIFGIAGAIAFGLVKGRKKTQKKEWVQTPPSVRVVKASPESQAMVVEAFGTVKPRKLVRVSVEVPGRIEVIHPAFVEGGFIPKGDLLVGIDRRVYDLDRQAAAVRVRQTRAEIRSLNQDIENLKKDVELSKTNVELALKEMKRIRALSMNDFASKNSLDKAEQAHLGARIQLQGIENRLTLTGPLMEQKKAALAMAEVDFQRADLAFQKARIKSEFNGWVLEKHAELGEVVSAGQFLGSFYEQGALDVDVRIPLEEMKWIESFFKNGKTPRARVMASNGETLAWEARVARIKAKIDEKTRTLPMTLEILNKENPSPGIFDLKPGSFVKCRIMGDVHENIFVLDRDLLKSGDRLFLATGSVLEIRKVRVLRKFEDKVYVSQGIGREDLIISSPLPGAVEGMALNIKPVEDAQ